MDGVDESGTEREEEGRAGRKRREEEEGEGKEGGRGGGGGDSVRSCVSHRGQHHPESRALDAHPSGCLRPCYGRLPFAPQKNSRLGADTRAGVKPRERLLGYQAPFMLHAPSTWPQSWQQICVADGRSVRRHLLFFFCSPIQGRERARTHLA